MPQGRKTKQAAQSLLSSLDIRGSLQGLVQRAVIQGWSMDEFAARLVQTKAFRRAFPGLVDFKTGQIKTDFLSGASVSFAQSLVSAVGGYRRGFDDFQAVASKLGIHAPSKDLYAQMISRDISLDEYGQRLQIIQNVKSNPGLLDAYNEQRKFMGLKPYTQEQLLKGIAQKSPDFYDPYQAAFLRDRLGLSVEQAASVAKGIDTGLQPLTDLSKLASDVAQQWSAYGPEAERAGIDKGYLTLLAAGQDPRGLGPKLQQIAAQRQAMSSVTYTQPRQSSTGGLSLFPEEEAPAY